MSKYTTELRYICEQLSGIPVESLDLYTPDQIISKSRKNIFNFSYPIYKESHREELETKILRHYYTREINAETTGLWQLQLNATLNDIMPKYNKLFMAEELSLQKELKNIDVTTDASAHDESTRTDDFTTSGSSQHSESGSQNSDSTRTDNLVHSSDTIRTDNLSSATDTTRTDNLVSGNTHRDRFSDTPQGGVTNVENDTYLTDYRYITDSGTNTGTQRNAGTITNTGTQRNAGSSSDNGTQRTAGNTSSQSSGMDESEQTNKGTSENVGDHTSTSHESGYRGSKTYFELMADYADKILNIDLMIIKELNNLFFLLW